MTPLQLLLPVVVVAQIKFLSPSHVAVTVGQVHDIEWDMDCPGCAGAPGSLGDCTINLVCSPHEYLGFELNNSDWEDQATNWSRVPIVAEKPIPSETLSSKRMSPTRMTHSVQTVFGLTSDIVPSSACALEMSITGPTGNFSAETLFWVGFKILSPLADASWPSGRSHQVKWQRTESRNWAEIALFKDGTEIVPLHPTEDSLGSPSKSSFPWCINSGSCWVFIPDVSSAVSYDGISDSTYQFRIRQFYYEGTSMVADQEAYIRSNSLEGWSDQFEVAFNLSTFYKDTSVIVYSSLLAVLLIAGLFGVGYFRNEKRKQVLTQLMKLVKRAEDEKHAEIQQQLVMELVRIVIASYFEYLIETYKKFEKRKKLWNVWCIAIVVPLMKATFDLCYDVWQYTVHHPHPIFIVDIVFQIIGHISKMRYDYVRLEEMRDADKKTAQMVAHSERLISLLGDMLGEGKIAKQRNVSTQGKLRIICLTCEQINGVVAVFLAAHMDLTWTDWGTQNGLLQIKLLLQVLSFNWSFLMLIRELVSPMKSQMALIRTANQISIFGVMFVIQRNMLLGVIYAGIWRNPTLEKFGTNATLTLVILYMLLSPLAELLYFVTSLVSYVFEDIQKICMAVKAQTSDRLELEQLKRDSDQARINKQIGFFSASLISQAIFLVILNVTNTFDYTIEAYYVRVGVTIYVCLANFNKVAHVLYSILFCRCWGWGAKDMTRQNMNKVQHACCCFWTGGLWFPCLIGALCRCCCYTPCNCDNTEGDL